MISPTCDTVDDSHAITCGERMYQRRHRYVEHKRRVQAFCSQAAVQARLAGPPQSGPDRSNQTHEKMTSLELAAFAHTTVLEGSHFLFAGHNTAAAVLQVRDHKIIRTCLLQ